MATSTFERKIEITEPEAVKKLRSMMSDNEPAKPLSAKPYSEKERETNVRRFEQCLSRSKT